MVDYNDRVLKCMDCGAEFVFTAGEQLFFANKNFTNDPKRCKSCKTLKKKQVPGGGRQQGETTTVCSQCGRKTTVPFRPTQGRPVYCRECFQQRRVAFLPANPVQ